MIRLCAKRLLASSDMVMMKLLKDVHNEEIFQHPDEAIAACLKVDITTKQIEKLLAQCKGRMQEPKEM